MSADPPPVPPAGPPPVPPAGYAYNWGLAYPAPGYQPVVLVPRPPRPGVVNLATTLTYLGVVLSAVGTALGLIVAYINRDELTSQVSAQAPPDSIAAADLSRLTGVALGVAVAINVVTWVLPAAGALVTAILSRRGANPARIVLASLMGLYTLVQLCSGISALVNVGASSGSTDGWSVASAIVDAVLATLAVAIGTLLLVPPANRFFTAGPGRRFATSN